MKKLIKYLLEEAMGIKDADIEEVEENGKVTLTINVSPELIGLVIGKGGKTIKAIQSLARIRGKLEKRIVFVNVSESTSKSQ
ncbi:hypothetical protein A2962_04715 [Candidatus Woesebacteria bacterium RIFCSPLOWO2_01_FULL_39_61]|uniref:Uncharacterized protein n=1 Tax=Candidatus Woesebacteria bacterium RIFCSPHIGHO2_02_FULL_39_13 TaxID=1802505 RepID=A0A1F7Z3V8_9BACT|nr:MAG: hypothetical protein A2692_01035 [Candidatus Woesebacteria bacterium RIFCSPHIGHO2_01_FULL_39_95]OGM34302.1 MAG: hypothetical protein A3D01_00840 [Candidatus Woesebacteria bacterium RIFCSPHIGHO2_02_FULL_39_13]OGM39084.1 MAG: hypothetical protein A3E13_01565 [Candidatus Woesebacteria bacterium RIFCSPHIGHO2_12_FULL_40_20]OGM68639.1 MAG: hypothetical protein A2962_04715 [Candidatus Woesebacteria bacterium RIFCSPLOWO2_01_FULL_39_61]OGM73983.1 MAG: hypothetical protein A3H19_00645 [Candidatus